MQAARRWGISDRRVRVLCGEGKIPGVFKDGKSYKIPEDAVKPGDGREKKITPPSGFAVHPSKEGKAVRFLKWENDIVGMIDDANAVRFVHPEYNEVVYLYTRGAKSWTPDQFTEFLSERVVSRDRRDIERILFRLGLSHYDVLRVAEVTRGIHPKDLLWIANSEGESFSDVITAVFDSVFHKRVDLVGDSVDTPEGHNIKRYGVHEGNYGIYNSRFHRKIGRQ